LFSYRITHFINRKNNYKNYNYSKIIIYPNNKMSNNMEHRTCFDKDMQRMWNTAKCDCNTSGKGMHPVAGGYGRDPMSGSCKPVYEAYHSGMDHRTCFDKDMQRMWNTAKCDCNGKNGKGMYPVAGGYGRDPMAGSCKPAYEGYTSSCTSGCGCGRHRSLAFDDSDNPYSYGIEYGSMQE
jgi:hypothetical protein